MSSLKHQAVKSVFWVTLANIIGKLAVFASTPIIVRNMTKEDIGAYGIIISIVNICLIAVSFGFDYWYVRARDRENWRYAVFFKIGVITTVTLSIVIFLCAHTVANWMKYPQMTEAIQCVGIYFVLGGTTQIFYQYLAKHLLFKISSTATIARQLIQAIMSIILVLILHNLYALVWSYIAGSLVEFFILSFATRQPIVSAIKKWHSINLISTYTRNYKFTINMVGAQLVNSFAKLSVSPIIGRTIGLSAAGVYATMDTAISLPVNLIVGSISTTALPILSRINNKNLSLSNVRISKILLAISIPFFIYALIYASKIIEIFLGPSWVSGTIVLRLLMVVAFVNLVVSPISQNFILKKKTDHLLYWNSILMIGNITILVTLGNLGLNLAILAFAIFNTVMRIILQIMLGKLLLLGTWGINKLYLETAPQTVAISAFGLISYTAGSTFLKAFLLIIGLVSYILILWKHQPCVAQDLKNMWVVLFYGKKNKNSSLSG